MNTYIDHQTVVSELHAALEATLKFGQRFQAAQWEPNANSEGATELSNTEPRHSGRLWGQDPPRTAYAAANLMMGAIFDDLASIDRLLGEPMPVLGATLVARSAIEIGSTVWWLMEPGIGVRRRVCRELVLSLTSARRAGQVAQHLQAGQAADDALQQEARVLQRINDLKIAAPTSGYNPTIEGEKAENATKATTQMLKAALPAGASAETIYRVYSAVMHGEIYGLMNFMAPGVQSDGKQILHWHLPPDVLNSTVQLAIVALREPYRRIRKVMGWGHLEGDLWEIKMAKIFNRL